MWEGWKRLGLDKEQGKGTSKKGIEILSIFIL
jgi:hypothetical protein